MMSAAMGMHRRCETDGDDRHQQIKRRQLIADVEGSEPETAGILLAHIDELGQALNQHYRPAQPRFSDDSDQ